MILSDSRSKPFSKAFIPSLQKAFSEFFEGFSHDLFDQINLIATINCMQQILLWVSNARFLLKKALVAGRKTMVFCVFCSIQLNMMQTFFSRYCRQVLFGGMNGQWRVLLSFKMSFSTTWPLLLKAFWDLFNECQAKEKVEIYVRLNFGNFLLF